MRGVGAENVNDSGFLLAHFFTTLFTIFIVAPLSFHFVLLYTQITYIYNVNFQIRPFEKIIRVANRLVENFNCKKVYANSVK